jgi:hypothetical protein
MSAKRLSQELRVVMAADAGGEERRDALLRCEGRHRRALSVFSVKAQKCMSSKREGRGRAYSAALGASSHW